MSCETIEPKLLGFHFGTCTADERAEVEAHLPGCARCVGSWLGLKRSLDAELTDGPSPSLGVKTRLRAAVAETLRERHAPKPWRWWEPALAFGSATAVVVAAMVSTWGVTLLP